MNSFWFALWHSDEIRSTGSVAAVTLPDALRVVSKCRAPRLGDRLEIGVHGFPPARYRCVEEEASLSWRLVMARAA